MLDRCPARDRNPGLFIRNLFEVHERGYSMNRLDTVTLNIIHNALTNIASEMALVMLKTSYSTIFNEGLRGAELILPLTTMAEENGTYVNRDRRIQRYNQAKAQPGMSRPAWWVAGEVIAGPGPSASAPSTSAEAFELLAERWPAFAGITYSDIGYTGLVLQQSDAALAGSQRADLGFM